MIGVYRSRVAALAAIDRLKMLLGFRDAPRFIDPHAHEEGDGFYIDEYELDKDHWTEGFFTAT